MISPALFALRDAGVTLTGGDFVWVTWATQQMLEDAPVMHTFRRMARLEVAARASCDPDKVCVREFDRDALEAAFEQNIAHPDLWPVPDYEGVTAVVAFWRAVDDRVVPLAELMRPDPDRPDRADSAVLDTSRCYICGTSNFEGDHLDEAGFPIACPTGISRATADLIREERAR